MMPASKLFNYPTGAFLMVRYELWIICKDELEAKLLRIIERYVEERRAFLFSERVNAGEKIAPDEVIEIDKDIWVPISHRLFMNDLFDTVTSENTVKKALKSLESKRLIFSQFAPKKRYDAPLYQLHTTAIQTLLDLIGKPGYQCLIPSIIDTLKNSPPQFLTLSGCQKLIPLAQLRVSNIDTNIIKVTNHKSTHKKESTGVTASADDTPTRALVVAEELEQDEEQAPPLSQADIEQRIRRAIAEASQMLWSNGQVTEQFIMQVTASLGGPGVAVQLSELQTEHDDDPVVEADAPAGEDRSQQDTEVTQAPTTQPTATGVDNNGQHTNQRADDPADCDRGSTGRHPVQHAGCPPRTEETQPLSPRADSPAQDARRAGGGATPLEAGGSYSPPGYTPTPPSEPSAPSQDVPSEQKRTRSRTPKPPAPEQQQPATPAKRTRKPKEPDTLEPVLPPSRPDASMPFGVEKILLWGDYGRQYKLPHSDRANSKSYKARQAACCIAGLKWSEDLFLTIYFNWMKAVKLDLEPMPDGSLVSETWREYSVDLWVFAEHALVELQKYRRKKAEREQAAREKDDEYARRQQVARPAVQVGALTMQVSALQESALERRNREMLEMFATSAGRA